MIEKEDGQEYTPSKDRGEVKIGGDATQLESVCQAKRSEKVESPDVSKKTLVEEREMKSKFLTAEQE